MICNEHGMINCISTIFDVHHPPNHLTLNFILDVFHIYNIFCVAHYIITNIFLRRKLTNNVLIRLNLLNFVNYLEHQFVCDPN